MSATRTGARRVPRIALTRGEAARSLGMGLTSFKKYVVPEVRAVRRGSLVLYPVPDLERWADKNAERVIE